MRFFLSERVDWRPLGRCEVLLVWEPSTSSVTFFVGQAPVTLSSTDLANVLVLASAVYTRVEDTAEAHAHLLSGGSGPAARPSRARRDWRVGAGGFVAGLVLGLGAWFLMSRHDKSLRAAVSGFAYPSDATFLADVDDPGPVSPSYPLPDKPFRNQGTPPCKTKKAAVEINGGCWVELAQKPPCDDEVAEYKGKCYLPTTKGKPLPQSVEP
ncbi:hypothetical protein [Melittangium boletus]|uniref:hypothetical protein n=1 Tax=Melittangium boletus TaxID=83453 RepID=UPI001FE80274|nr:hypothetical protein [Melittangium boletus]